MSTPVKIIDGSGSELETYVHAFETGHGTHHGLVVLAQEFLEFDPGILPFLNPTNGTAMNKAVTFGGAKLRATVLHAGVNSGSAESGTTDGATTPDKLIQSGQNFETTLGPGALVHNTSDTTYAIVTAVDSDTQLSLDTDIMATGENYVINDIWPGTVVAGTWNFADSGKFTITNANNNDEATFTVDAAHIWNATHFVSLTGKVDLDTYDSDVNSMSLEFGLDGVLVGNSVNLDDFIDTGIFTEQNFVISKDSFGLSTQNFNSMRIVISRSGGARPDVKFDDFQWENTGTPIVYKASAAKGTRFHVDEIRIRIQDAISSVLTDGSMPNIDPDAILGVSALTNGISFSRTQKNEVAFAVTLKTLSDFFAAGSDIDNVTGNATNTGLTMLVRFPKPIILDGNAGDNLTFTINDDMSNLTKFTASARGALEI